MLSYFRNCKRCGFGFFANDFKKIDLFCDRCWMELEKHRANPKSKIYKTPDVFVRPLFLWHEKESIVADLIYGLKGGAPIDVMEKLCSELCKKYDGDSSKIIVPVPPSKVGERDHSYVMAKIISRKLGLKFWNELEWINKNTNQKFLRKQDRFISEMVPRKPFPRSNQIILIDDLVTTGATAAAAKKAIKSLKDVEVWSLACRI